MPSGRKTIRTRRPAAAHDRATAYARSHRSLRASGMMATSCTRLSFSCAVCPSSHRPSPPTLEVAGIEPPNVLHKRSTHALLSTTMTDFRFSQGAAPSTSTKRYSRGSTPYMSGIEPREPAGADGSRSGERRPSRGNAGTVVVDPTALCHQLTPLRSVVPSSSSALPGAGCRGEALGPRLTASRPRGEARVDRGRGLSRRRSERRSGRRAGRLLRLKPIIPSQQVIFGRTPVSEAHAVALRI